MPPVITSPPANLDFVSISELYEQFQNLFIGKEFYCPRGNPVVITPHHFFHLVKLQKGMQTDFTIEVEEPLIQNTKDGFGAYSVDMNRALRLSWIPELLKEPHEIWEYLAVKTAEEVLIREYDKSGSAYRALLLKRENEHLKVITCMPMRGRAVLDLPSKAKKLWP